MRDFIKIFETDNNPKLIDSDLSDILNQLISQIKIKKVKNTLILMKSQE